MTKKQNILLRDVPQNIYTWIESQRHTRRVSQKEFLLKVLETAATYNVSDTLFPFTPAVSFRRPTETPFTFIDLFAGIGGMHIGLEKAGGECVFACEWDKHSQKTYTAWFGMCPHGDIKKIALPHRLKLQIDSNRIEFRTAPTRSSKYGHRISRLQSLRV